MDLGDSMIESNPEVKPAGVGSEDQDGKKVCFDCKTSRTPLWRSGPAGPKSLCNACGIRHRKKRRAAMALETASDNKRSKTHQTVSPSSPAADSTSTSESTTTSTDTAKSSAAAAVAGTSTAAAGGQVRLRVVYSGKGSTAIQKKKSSSSSSPRPPAPIPQPLVVVKKQRCQRRRKMAEEEQAAFCLMALSCASVFA